MKYIFKNKKQETGAISTLVLFTILMFILILMGVYLTITTMQKSQLKSDMRIMQIYQEDVDRVNEIYNNLIKENNIVVLPKNIII